MQFPKQLFAWLLHNCYPEKIMNLWNFLENSCGNITNIWNFAKCLDKAIFQNKFLFFIYNFTAPRPVWETLLKRASLTRCKSLRFKSFLRPKRNWEPCNKNGSLTWPSAYLGLNRDFSNSITAPWPTRPLSPISRQPLLKF